MEGGERRIVAAFCHVVLNENGAVCPFDLDHLRLQLVVHFFGRAGKGKGKEESIFPIGLFSVFDEIIIFFH